MSFSDRHKENSLKRSFSLSSFKTYRTILTLPHQHDLVLMASSFHLHLQLLTRLLDIAVNLVLLLLLHLNKRFPAHGILILKGARLCKSGWLLSLPKYKTYITNFGQNSPN